MASGPSPRSAATPRSSARTPSREARAWGAAAAAAASPDAGGAGAASMASSRAAAPSSKEVRAGRDRATGDVGSSSASDDEDGAPDVTDAMSEDATDDPVMPEAFAKAGGLETTVNSLLGVW